MKNYEDHVEALKANDQSHMVSSRRTPDNKEVAVRVDGDRTLELEVSLKRTN